MYNSMILLYLDNMIIVCILYILFPDASVVYNSFFVARTRRDANQIMKKNV